MQQHLAAMAADRQVRVLVLSGAGDKTFCAGASLQELGAGKLAGIASGNNRSTGRPGRADDMRPQWQCIGAGVELP